MGIYYVNERDTGYIKVTHPDYVKYDETFTTKKIKNASLRSNRNLQAIDTNLLDESERKRLINRMAFNKLSYSLCKKETQKEIAKIDTKTKYNQLHSYQILKDMNIG
jgi:hypothetical protein